MTICQPLPSERLRKFWTYAPGACGTNPGPCGDTCGKPGFTLSTNDAGQVTVSTAGRAASIAMLILMTRGAIAPGSTCARLPQKRAGYWADSYRTDGKISGTQVYYLPANLTTAQAVAMVKAYAESDLGKMVAMGEAESVSVDARYGGAGIIRLTARLVIDGQNVDVPLAAAGTGGVWTIGLLQ